MIARSVNIPSRFLKKLIGFPFAAVVRKRHVFLRRLTPRKLSNIFLSICKFIFGMNNLKTYPLLVKVDTTPLCHLKCPVCIHSSVSTANSASIFNKSMVMPFDIFKKMVDDCYRHTLALSLYHLGEAFWNKDLLRMIGYATQRGLNTYLTTNFSLKFTDDMFDNIVKSGLTYIIVSLDGFSQETYGKTRVNGNIELVKNNLENLIAARSKLSSKLPIIEVQSLLFDHNRHEKHQVIEYCDKIGVDILAMSEGQVRPWQELLAQKSTPRPDRYMPYCPWLFFASVVLYDGDVIPCCKYRLKETYELGENRLSMGNVTTDSMGNIFNGQK